MNSQNRTTDLTIGNPFTLLLGFSIPLMIGNIFQQLYTFADALIVGQKVGPFAMAAISSTEWITFIMFSVIGGITQGCSVIISAFFGRHDEEGVEKSIYSTYIVSLVTAVLFIVLGQLMIRPTLTLLHTPTEIIVLSTQYLRILFSGIPITVLYNMLSAIMRALGNSKQPLYAMVIASLSNVVLDLLFIVVFDMGVAGAAIATIIGQGFACLYCIIVIKYTHMYTVHLSGTLFSKEIAKDQLKLGLPMGLQSVITATGGLFVQATANGFGIIFVTGYAAANKLYALLEIAATSYAQGSLTYTAQNNGTHNTGRIKEGLRASLLIGCLTAVIMSVIMLFAGKTILGLFITTTEMDVTASISIGYQFLQILALGFPLLYILYIVRACVQGLGDSFYPMLSSFIQVIMRVSCALFLTRIIGFSGIFWGELCAWIGADVFLIIVLIKKLYKNGYA
ncbi:MAG: MATE family efflux transporter [Lachnospiraceae bacterium]|nr:MATE family efflux transporter [Lachnospiraceae bacterium]